MHIDTASDVDMLKDRMGRGIHITVMLLAIVAVARLFDWL
jgi:hypothetical protein